MADKRASGPEVDLQGRTDTGLAGPGGLGFHSLMPLERFGGFFGGPHPLR